MQEWQYLSGTLWRRVTDKNWLKPTPCCSELRILPASPVLVSFRIFYLAIIYIPIEMIFKKRALTNIRLRCGIQILRKPPCSARVKELQHLSLPKAAVITFTVMTACPVAAYNTATLFLSKLSVAVATSSAMISQSSVLLLQILTSSY